MLTLQVVTLHNTCSSRATKNLNWLRCTSQEWSGPDKQGGGGSNPGPGAFYGLSFHIPPTVNVSRPFWGQTDFRSCCAYILLCNAEAHRILFEMDVDYLCWKLSGPICTVWVLLSVTRSLQGPFWHFESLLGPHFHCSGFIHAKNVNSVCMYTTVSYLDLSVMSMNCTVVIHICWELMLQVFIIKDNWPLQRVFPILTP